MYYFASAFFITQHYVFEIHAYYNMVVTVHLFLLFV